MNLPKQSRPVIRDVSRDPISARVEAAQPSFISICLAACRRMPLLGDRIACENNCHRGRPPEYPPQDGWFN
jgi:hypothetical protein